MNQSQSQRSLSPPVDREGVGFLIHTPGGAPLLLLIHTDRVRFLLIFLALAMIGGCQDKGVEVERIKSPREYTWTVDTLEYPGSYQTAMRDIWGSSPTDVHVVGHNDQNRGLMWHFDGVKWEDVKLSTTQGGTIQGAIDLSAIRGFASNDIWVVGERISSNPNPPPNFLDSSLIIHFDGAQWTEHRVSGGRSLQAVWGSTPNDVWVGGLEGSLYYYNGGTWERFNNEDRVWFTSFSGLSRDAVYGLGYRLDAEVRDTTFRYLWEWNGTQWALEGFFIETYGNEAEFGSHALLTVEGVVYSCGYGGVFRKVVGGWERVFNDSVNDVFVRLGGNAGDNLFGVGGRSLVYHYDGVDWYRYPQFSDPTILFTAVWTDGKEAFMVGNDGSRTYILHGR